VCTYLYMNESNIFLPYLKATTLYPGGIRSHDQYLQSPRWQAETIPTARPNEINIINNNRYVFTIICIGCACIHGPMQYVWNQNYLVYLIKIIKIFQQWTASWVGEGISFEEISQSFGEIPGNDDLDFIRTDANFAYDHGICNYVQRWHLCTCWTITVCQNVLCKVLFWWPQVKKSNQTNGYIL
jgi:hypothetical protein